jgi:hypothetical protein
MKLRKSCIYSPRLKRKRRIKLFSISFLFLFSVSAFVFGLHSFFASGYISIQNIVLSGNKDASSDALKNIARDVQEQKILGLFKKDNLLLFNRSSFLSQVYSAMPVVKDVTISFEGLDTLDLLVSERVPFAKWCGGALLSYKKCLVIDETGFAFKETGDEFSDLISIYDDVSTSSPNIREVFSSNANNLIDTAHFFASIGWPVKEIIKNSGYFVFRVEGNGEIRLPFDFDVENIKSRLPLVKVELEKEGSEFKYLDFRFTDKVFIKR